MHVAQQCIGNPITSSWVQSPGLTAALNVRIHGWVEPCFKLRFHLHWNVRLPIVSSCGASRNARISSNLPLAKRVRS